MFVEALKRQNPALISAALSLWQQGKIAPDSWVIDVDQVLENGKRLIETAGLYGIELYLMTVSYTHLTLPTSNTLCRSRWSPSH